MPVLVTRRLADDPRPLTEPCAERHPAIEKFTRGSALGYVADSVHEIFLDGGFCDGLECGFVRATTITVGDMVSFRGAHPEALPVSGVSPGSARRAQGLNRAIQASGVPCASAMKPAATI